jgi:hypothetical protein
MNRYSPLLVVGGVSIGAGGAAAGGGGGAARRVGAVRARGVVTLGAGGATDDWAAGALRRLAGSRLTSETVVAAGPTGPAVVVPTVIFSASGFPVLSTGAVAVAGTV